MEKTTHRKIKSCAKKRVQEYMSSLTEIRERARKLFRSNKLVEMMYVLRDTGLTYLVKRRADGQVVMAPRRRKRRSRRSTGLAKEKPSTRHSSASASSRSHSRASASSYSHSSASTNSHKRRRRKHRHDHQEPYCQICEDRRKRREEMHEHREHRDSLVYHRNQWKHRSGGDHEHHEYAEHPRSVSVTQPPAELMQSATATDPVVEMGRPESLSARTKVQVPRPDPLSRPLPAERKSTRRSSFLAPLNEAALSLQAERKSTRASSFLAPVSEVASRPVSYSDYQLPEERLSMFSELHLGDDRKRDLPAPRFRSTGEMGNTVRQSRMASVATFKTSSFEKPPPPCGGQGLNNLIHQELRNGWSSSDEDGCSSSDDDEEDADDEYEEGEEEVIDLNGED